MHRSARPPQDSRGRSRLLWVLGLLVALCAACTPASIPSSAATAPDPREAEPPAAAAAAPQSRTSLKTAYPTAGAIMATVWLAHESGAFAQQGLDVEVVFIGGGQALLGALASQEAPLVLAGANQAIEANLQGGDYVILGATMPYITNSIYVQPAIMQPDELRGQSLGVSNFGTISHVAVKVALKQWGLVEGRDVTVIRSGGTPETLAALQSGAIAGGSFSPPQTFHARELGFHELIDLAATRYEFGSATVLSTRRYVAQHPDVVERYLKALMRGAHAFKTDRELAVDSIMRHTHTDDRALAETTWAWFRDLMSDDLLMSRQAVENNLRLLGDERPEALAARPEQFLDLSFVERIRASGYVQQVQQRP
jgi:NitT/TauT family transport system substrate-binding protein